LRRRHRRAEVLNDDTRLRVFVDAARRWVERGREGLLLMELQRAVRVVAEVRGRAGRVREVAGRGIYRVLVVSDRNGGLVRFAGIA